MRLYSLLLPFLPSVLASSISISVLSNQHVPNPSSLPPSTVATLTSIGHNYVAPLSISNDFKFRNVTSGSYLLAVSCATNDFSPVRIDVGVTGDGVVEAWATFRGNEWDNKGQIVTVTRKGSENRLEITGLAGKEYYAERGAFSPMSLLKNPMILIGGVSMILVFGMPYLIENMDPEMRAEYEATQKAGGLTAALTGQKTPADNPMANFDAAAWLAGKSSKTSSSKS